MTKKGSVKAYGRNWNVLLEDNGEVWYEDEKGLRHRLGTRRAKSIEDAEDAALEMLRSMGSKEEF